MTLCMIHVYVCYRLSAIAVDQIFPSPAFSMEALAIHLALWIYIRLSAAMMRSHLYSLALWIISNRLSAISTNDMSISSRYRMKSVLAWLMRVIRPGYRGRRCPCSVWHAHSRRTLQSSPAHGQSIYWSAREMTSRKGEAGPLLAKGSFEWARAIVVVERKFKYSWMRRLQSDRVMVYVYSPWFMININF